MVFKECRCGSVSSGKDRGGLLRLGEVDDEMLDSGDRGLFYGESICSLVSSLSLLLCLLSILDILAPQRLQSLATEARFWKRSWPKPFYILNREGTLGHALTGDPKEAHPYEVHPHRA